MKEIIHKKCNKRIEDCICKDARVVILNKSAQELGKITSIRKKKTSAENGRKASEIRARLTVYGHEDMSDKEFKFFKKWITKIVGHTATNKRGDLSKIFRQTLYKQ